jgi:hypothetical protein
MRFIKSPEKLLRLEKEQSNCEKGLEGITLKSATANVSAQPFSDFLSIQTLHLDQPLPGVRSKGITENT